MSEGLDLRVQLWCHRIRTQPLKRLSQRVRKAVQPVPVGHNALALDVIEHSANLFSRKFVMIEKGNKAGDGPLEVDVVLPQRVVSVDKKGLRRQAVSSWPLALSPIKS